MNGKNLEGNGRGLIDIPQHNVPGRTERNHGKSSG
jgi:hypothetical protein